MLVLNRRQNEELVIGGDIRVRVLRVRGKSVSLAIDAPGCVSILRSEIVDQDATSTAEAFSVVRLRESAPTTLAD
ncbi:MAG: carbon storage regulator [Planctomycetaceae bacterium]|jgi:carbon storage regulator|nr:carbon storage regulator [Planctomycetaceae bacterium]